jgi:hypothetical protein
MASLLLLAPALCRGASIGQIDTFENGTNENWVVALLGAIHPAPPFNTTVGGGPAGPDDNYLRATAIGGVSAGSMLTIINITQWAGDYIAEGITHISMDVRNSGATDLNMRLVFENLGSMGPTDLAFSSTPLAVPAGSDWMPIVFPIAPSFLTAGLGSVDLALSSADVLRIYHGTAAQFPPAESIVALLDIDNISALAIPEPGSLWLTTGALALLLAGIRRARS